MYRTSQEPFRVVVAAGGTGGHIFPAVAVVEQLQVLTNGRCSALFLGSDDRMETTLIPGLGFPFVPMPIRGYKGILSPSFLTLPIKILRSVRIAREAIRRHRAQAVICTGAYISYPAGLAALRENVPLFVLESNLNPGKTNARLAPRATAVVLAFEESRAFYPEDLQERLHVFGNPVRTQIDPSIDPAMARHKLGLNPDRPVVFVFGGSLGARSINTAVDAALPMLATSPYQVLWQTGKVFEPGGTIPPNVVVKPFIDDMGLAYAAADLVVSRSGATTIAELGILGKPSILVPLPSASTNEQMHNARVVEQHGGALVIGDADVARTLVASIDGVMRDAERRHRMGDAVRQLGRPNAAADTARLVLQLCPAANTGDEQ